MLEASIYPASPRERDFSSTFRYTYIGSGPKFRATCKLVSATQGNTTKLSEAAFNGTSFATYIADTRTATRQAQTPNISNSELPYCPLIAPFLFLTKNSDNCTPCLIRFSDIVSPDFSKGLILPKGQLSNGLLHLSMPGLPLAKKPTAWTVDIDEAGGSFTPEKVSLVIEAGQEIVWKLLNYTNVGGYEFPTKIVMTVNAYPPTSPPTWMSTITVTVISARIPDRIPDSTFSLEDEEKSAATVWDSDRMKTVKSPYDELKANLRTQPDIYDESADGAKQIADALELARKEHKHVLLQFGANWCLPCHQLHKLFETDKNIAEELEKDYVVVMIDMNKGHNKDVDTKYGNPMWLGLPAIVILDAAGKQLIKQDTRKLTEGDHHSPDQVVAFLKEWAAKKQP